MNFRNLLTIDDWVEKKSQRYRLKNIKSISSSNVSDFSKNREHTDRVLSNSRREEALKDEPKKVSNKISIH